MEITQNQIDKWTPIFNHMGVIDEALIKLGVIYAESKSRNYNRDLQGVVPLMLPIPPTPTNSNKFRTNRDPATYLPIGLKILFKLNLNGKNVEILDIPTNEISTYHFRVEYPNVEQNDIITDNIEDLLIDKVVLAINENLENYDTILIYDLVSLIDTVTLENYIENNLNYSVSNETVILILNSRIKFK